LGLLERAELAGQRTPYYTPELQYRRLLALAQLTPTALPADDRGLLLRAQAALKQGDGLRGAQYLDAAEEKEKPHWNYLRGMAHRSQQEYREAAECFQKAMEYDPKACAAALEECYREQGDYKQAYHYACLLREMGK
jgi:tetratricopeptide (TPR) repeat protein